MIRLTADAALIKCHGTVDMRIFVQGQVAYFDAGDCERKHFIIGIK